MQAEEQITKIDTPRAIAKILTRHFQSRGKFTLLTLSGDVRGETAIVANDPDARYLLVDTLPKSIARTIETARCIQVRGAIGSLYTWFECDDLQVIEEGLDRYYEIPYPAELFQLQRRNAFRVGLPTRTPASMRGRASNPNLDTDIAFFGRIDNISATGIGIILNQSLAALMPVGTIIFEGHIVIEDHLNIILDAEVRNNRPINDHESVIGMEFSVVSPSDALTIARAVLDVQRAIRMDEDNLL
ncbi:flagellar brake protein [Rhodoferax sp. 4810]|uniref:Flagellar brake protein n=1 Tax=Thiospirillum jenense TaxID=1653858 RepID=A0A839HDB5_9GAMM|nr:PilZ domain-containing protein [Thiospirillum jenense]MBB1074793.1 flagellar brake protein [Rhodoferax jenense]MBB1126631.1 flagellar brake protein [Thiospirillum jenense]